MPTIRDDKGQNRYLEMLAGVIQASRVERIKEIASLPRTNLQLNFLFLTLLPVGLLSDRHELFNLIFLGTALISLLSSIYFNFSSMSKMESVYLQTENYNDALYDYFNSDERNADCYKGFQEKYRNAIKEVQKKNSHSWIFFILAILCYMAFILANLGVFSEIQQLIAGGMK